MILFPEPHKRLPAGKVGGGGGGEIADALAVDVDAAGVGEAAQMTWRAVSAGGGSGRTARDAGDQLSEDRERRGRRVGRRPRQHEAPPRGFKRRSEEAARALIGAGELRVVVVVEEVGGADRVARLGG